MALDERFVSRRQRIDAARRSAVMEVLRSARSFAAPPAGAPRPATRIPPGTVVADRFELERLLGAGGFGAVYAARDRLGGGRAAVKVLTERYEGWQDEMSVLRLLRLPNVVGWLDDGEHAGLAWIATELLDAHPFPVDGRGWDALAPIALGLLEAVARVHEVGVVHRDLKPANVLVDDAGVVTLLDFGFARHRSLDLGHGHDGFVVGTPAYLAPEIVFGETPDARSDLWAIGAMLYEALSGRYPHAGDEVDLLTRRVSEAVVPLGDVAPEVPVLVADVVDGMLTLDPDDRIGSVGEVLATLSTWRRVRSGLPAGDGAVRDDDTFDVAELADRFEGPDVVHHLREDAAVELFARTDGVRARVEEELGAWVRAGLARPVGERFALRRDDLDRLGRGLAVDPAPRNVPIPASHVREAAELLQWLMLFPTGVAPELLARVTHTRAGALRAALVRLEEAGLVVGRGGAVHAVGISAGRRWTAERRAERRALAADALPPGSPGRLEMLVALGRNDQAVDEALAVATRALGGGDYARAASTALEGLGLALRRERREDAARAADLAALGALELSSSRLLADLLRRMGSLGDARRRTFVRLALDALVRGGAEVVEALHAAPPHPEPRLEGWRFVAAAFAARGAPLDLHVAAVEALAAHAAAAPGWSAAAWTARAQLAYRQGRIAEAADLHGRSVVAAGELGRDTLSGRLNRADALLDAGAPEEAGEVARAALGDAVAARRPLHEAYLSILLRASAQRRGQALAPDPDLVEAVAHLDTPWLLGFLLLVECADAWRRGEVPPDLEARAIAAWRAAGREEPEALIRAMGIASRGGPAADARALLDRVPHLAVPGAVAQVVALLAPLVPLTEADRAAAHDALARMSPMAPEVRREVLSLDELRARLG